MNRTTWSTDIPPNCIRLSAYSEGQDYIGRITVYENGRRLWRESAKIRRLNRADALDDARRLAVGIAPASPIYLGR